MHKPHVFFKFETNIENYKVLESLPYKLSVSNSFRINWETLSFRVSFKMYLTLLHWFSGKRPKLLTGHAKTKIIVFNFAIKNITLFWYLLQEFYTFVQDRNVISNHWFHLKSLLQNGLRAVLSFIFMSKIN